MTVIAGINAPVDPLRQADVASGGVLAEGVAPGPVDSLPERAHVHLLGDGTSTGPQIGGEIAEQGGVAVRVFVVLLFGLKRVSYPVILFI